MSELTRITAAGKADTVEPADRPTEPVEPAVSATDATTDTAADTGTKADSDGKADKPADEAATDSAASTDASDASNEEQAAPAEPPPPPSGTSRAGGPLGWLIPGLAALLVVLLVLITVFGYQAYSASRVDQARSQALSAATAAAVDVLSYDHRHLDQDFAKANRHLAPDFAKQYGKTTSTVVKPSALKIKAVVSAQVIKGSVVSATKDQVVTLLFVNQTTSSTLRSGKRTDLNRVRMTMERVDDRWLVASVQAL